MKKVVITLGSVSFAALIGVGLGFSTAHAQPKVDCAKVMSALNGPDVTPRHVSQVMKIPLASVKKCQADAAKASGSGPIPNNAAHPVVGPGGNQTDPGDYATKMKQRAW